MNESRSTRGSGIASVVPASSVSGRGWQGWAPDAAVAWSLLYAALGIAWALGAAGFPYAPTDTPNPLGSLLSRLGPVVAWAVIALAGIPAAAIGVAMRRNVKGALRRFFIACGALLASEVTPRRANRSS